MAEKALKVLLDIGKVVLLVLFSVMIIVGFMQVFWRYVLRVALPWSEELMRYCYVWSTFVGLPIVMTMGGMAVIDTISSRFKGLAEDIYNFVIMAIEGYCFYIMIHHGINFCKVNVLSTSASMGIPMTYITSSVVVSGFYGILCLILSFILKIQEIRMRGTLQKGGNQ